MLRVGLTGGIAAGKSTASARLAELGAVVIDYDMLARQAVAPGSPLLPALRARFGSQIFDDDDAASCASSFSRDDVGKSSTRRGGAPPSSERGRGSLNRARLAALVFGDQAALADLDGLVHPEVYRLAAEAEEAAVAANPRALVVHDIPLLAEKGLTAGLDAVVAVEASDATRFERLVASRGLTVADARARMAAGATEEQRRAAVAAVPTAYFLDGNCSPANLTAQVDELWPQLAALRDQAGESPGKH